MWLPCAMGSVEGTHCLNRMTWLPTAFIRRCVSIVFLSFFFFVDFIATIHVDVIVFDGKTLFESTQLLAWCRCCMRGGQTLSPSEGPTWTTGVPGVPLFFLFSTYLATHLWFSPLIPVAGPVPLKATSLFIERPFLKPLFYLKAWLWL